VSNSYRGTNNDMRTSVYNSAILKVDQASRALPAAPHLRAALCALFLLFVASRALSFPAANFSELEQQLAREIAAVTGPGAVALTISNRSSLSKRESDVVGNGLRTALEAMGIRFVAADRAAASVAITLSENQSSYVWVAEVRQGAGERAIVMVSTPRAEGLSVARDAVPLTLHKAPLWKQPTRILDLAILEETSIPTHIAVLDGEQVTLYRWQSAKWELEQSFAISHARPWPRDLRGRLVPAKDHLFDVYLPGVKCHTTSAIPLALNCRESDDPWPLMVSAGTPSAPLNAFFAPARNFFTGVVSPRIGKFSTVPRFYSLASLPRDRYVLWLFAAVDGQTHMIDGVSDQTVNAGSDKSKWSSDIAGIQTMCGAGWQVLAVSSVDDGNGDFVRAYEVPDRDPVAVSAAVDLPGEVTAFWTEAKGDNVIAVARNRETGEYEAFRLAITCSQ
jgi:hypothetical protein